MQGSGGGPNGIFASKGTSKKEVLIKKNGSVFISNNLGFNF